MKVVVATVVVAVFLLASPSSEVGAQEWRQIPNSFTNSQQYRITGFTARVTGSGCVGSQNYVKIGNPSDKGVSARRWTKATKQDGGIVCSGGTWHYGGAGPKAGKPGGKEPDLLIKDGKFYRRG